MYKDYCIVSQLYHRHQHRALRIFLGDSRNLQRDLDQDGRYRTIYVVYGHRGGSSIACFQIHFMSNIVDLSGHTLCRKKAPKIIIRLHHLVRFSEHTTHCALEKLCINKTNAYQSIRQVQGEFFVNFFRHLIKRFKCDFRSRASKPF
uniref:Uncharacterized protein n=1 Tax=Glossina pallidipes TaxID=7398 RepID=A0A1A9ZUF7_GLOPL